MDSNFKLQYKFSDRMNFVEFLNLLNFIYLNKTYRRSFILWNLKNLISIYVSATRKFPAFSRPSQQFSFQENKPYQNLINGFYRLIAIY